MIELPAVFFRLTPGLLELDLKGEPGLNAENWLKTQKSGFVRVQLGKPAKPRTTGEHSQNAHINGHIQQIALATDNGFDLVKLACKQESLSAGYPYKKIADQIVPLSESEIDTEQAAILIETIHRVAAELGVVLTEGE